MELSFITKLAEMASIRHIPFSGQFELTPVCNLRCRMCYVHRVEEDYLNRGCLLPVSFWLDVAQQMRDAGTLVLSLTGGETLLYPEIDALMDGLKPMGFLISFNTNGTLVDDERVKWFQKYGPTKINISLYGASNATYETLCGLSDGFDRVDYAIRSLLKAGLNVYLNAVVVPENRQDLPAMYAYAAKLGLELHATPYIFATKSRCLGLDVKEADYRLSAEEAAEVYFESLSITGGDGLVQQQSRAILSQIAAMRNHIAQGHILSFPTCRGGKCDYAISWRGALQPCVMFDQASVSLLEEKDFLHAWDDMSKQMDALDVPQACKRCERMLICPACKASLYQESGNMQDAPEYLCQYSQAVEAIAKKRG